MSAQRCCRLAACLLALAAAIAAARNRSAEKGGPRDPKLLSLFQIVTFPNDPCVGSATKNGTCYTSDECTTKGGTNAGSCASGYGVCCTFTENCGGTSSENCTYIESTGSEVGGCKVEICRCNNNICQLRLDFNTFMITGPSTVTDSLEAVLNGDSVPGPAASGVASSLATRCLTDLFSVTNPGGVTPSSICGTNTGQHMYVDASECCNDFVFQLGTAGIGTGLATRQWSIKVTQYDCNYCNLAPEGCTQYYFGQTTDTVQSYNYAGGQHLADQNQNICVRRERGNCRICWTHTAVTDFQVSGAAASMLDVKASACCGYGTNGKGTMGYDCIVIPGAEDMAGSQKLSEICGRTKGIGTATDTPATVCSTRQPFNLRFLSDSFEQSTEGTNTGFMLTYIQDATNCPPT